MFRLTMLSLLRALSVVPVVLVGKVRREERRLVDWFRARGALDADRAATLVVEGAVRRAVFTRLQRAGVIKTVGERYYLEEGQYSAFRWRRKRRAFVMIALVLIAMALTFYMGDVSL